MRKLILALVGVMIASTVAYAAGLYTNGLPPVFPPGTTGNQTNLNGDNIGTGYVTLPLGSNYLIPMDTQLSSGRPPQTIAVTVSQMSLYSAPPNAITSAATLTINASLSNLHTITLGANSTLGTPSNLQAGQNFALRVQQDTVGSRVLTSLNIPIWRWSIPSNPAIASGVLLTTTANAVDLMRCTYDGTFILCAVTRDYITGNGGRPTSL